MRNSRTRFFVRKNRVKSKIAKLSNRPRLSVFKSGHHIYAQIIAAKDDAIDNIKRGSYTVVAASTLDKEIPVELKSKKYKCNVQFGKIVGELLAERAASKNITEVVFDRGGYKYHGVIKALADAARSKLSF